MKRWIKSFVLDRLARREIAVGRRPQPLCMKPGSYLDLKVEHLLSH